MKSIIRFGLVIILLNYLNVIFAQKDSLLNPTIDTTSNIYKYNRWSAYGYIGLSQLYGDIIPEYEYSPIVSFDGVLSKNVFFGVSRQWTKLFSVEGRFEMANLASYRYKSPEAINNDSLKFNSDFFHYEVSTSFSFSNWFWPNIQKRKWNSYLILGAGFTHYRSVSYYLNQNKYNKVFEYYGYDKVDDYTVKKANRQIVPSATIGIGVKYRLSNHFDIGFEIAQTSVYNDRLDAYVRVLSERDKFGHTSIGLVYHFERNDKTLVWDFPSEYNLLTNQITMEVQNRLCECPKITESFVALDTLKKMVNIVKEKSDSAIVYMNLERGIDTDNDKIPDYRDAELNSIPGAIVDANGVTISTANFVGNPNNPIKRSDSLVQVVTRLNMMIDTLLKERALERGLDTDRDGVPDYRDSEVNSPEGSVVNPKGIAIVVENARNVNSNEYIEPRMVVIRGCIVDDKKIPLEAQVDVIERSKNDTIAAFETNSETGKYMISLPAGKEYTFVIKSKGYSFFTENVVIPDTAKSKELEKGVSMIKLEAGKKIVLKNIFYDFNKSSLRPESNIELMNLLDLLISNPTLRIEISGHTDNIGSAKYNKKLSESRAKSVVDFLISKGIDKSRLEYAGYGFDQPIAPNNTDGGRQLNRRTEFKIIGN